MSDILNFISDPAERRKLLSSTLDVLNRGVVAGTLGAPVDLMNLGINAVKAGYGYAGHKMGLLSASDMPEIDEKPVGGSEWIAEQMQKRSLLGNYRNPTAEILAGGLLAPLAGAAVQARAPQIAAGLLKAQENLAAPSTIPQRGQRGAIVYHGSPHKFDKFDSSKIGTGEGAQAYGHGLYLAESPSVAKSYADSLSQYHIATKDGVRGGGDFADALVANAGEYPASLSSAIRSQANKIATDIASGKPTEQVLASMRNGPYARMYAGLADAVEKLAPSKAGGSLYKVDLPDSAIAKMLDWDKPLSEQPHVMDLINKQEAARTQAVLDQRMQTLANVGNDAPNAATLRRQIEILREEVANPQGSGLGSMTGGEYYNYLRRRDVPPTEQADMFRNAGIPGIRYLDGGSRGAGSGTSNFVVFPGEESLLRILERNGQTLP